MSLQVWLPLNGNLVNQGLADITVTNNGATVDSNGKIGKCYGFAKNAYIDIPPSSMTSFTTAASVSFWIKINSWNTNWDTIFQAGLGTTPWTSYTFGILRNSANYLCFCISDGSSYTSNSCKTGDLTLGQWYYLTMVYKTGHILCYVNGSLVQDFTTSVVPNFASITSIKLGGLANNYKCDCLLNDVRIYDHALSAKEIKELSKGLVLHYKLSGVDGNPNLAKGSNTNSTSTNKWNMSMQTGDKTLEVIEDDDIYCVKYIKGSGTSYSGWRFLWYGGITPSELKTNTVYTVSFDVKATVGGTITFTGILNTNATNYMTSSTTNISYEVTANQWCHLLYQCQTKSSFEDITIGGQGLYFNPASIFCNNGVEMFFKNLKLEEGSKTTPWCPNSSDSAYTFLEYDDTAEYDHSGFGNDGTKTNITTDLDTPRYSTSYFFDGDTSVITVPYDATAWQTNFTLNLWFKKHELGSKNYETLFGGPSGFEMDTRANNATTLSLYMTSTRGGNVYSPFNFDEWYMVTLVNDGTNELYYINGELVKTIEKKAMPTGNYFLGAWQTATKQNFKGWMSDFRIYATPLSEKDIKELYTVGTAFDKQGRVMTYEVVEV